MADNNRDVHQSLQRVFDTLFHKETIPLKDLKLVVFSDHHRGQNDSADDFRPCKPAYHAALGYYLEAGFTLILLGDVEELWECRPAKVIKTYSDTLALEQQYSRLGRYVRVWGNHDDHWQYPGEVDRFLGSFLSPMKHKTVTEGYTITVTSGDKSLGNLLFVHGHQGTLESDKFSRISRFLVRYLWRPFQRLTKAKPPTPVRDFQLRLTQEIAMHGWASQQSGLILITGHTHHPVFSSISHEARLKSEIEGLKQKLEKSKTPDSRDKIQEEISRKTANLNWVLAKSNGVALDFPGDRKPCYFNTGCCSYSDGDITGIEIEDGMIRLVRWPDDLGNPRQKVLQEGDLEKILRLCR